MLENDNVYLEKAAESLEGAESEFINRRYNNAANRSYYACFQAAIAALARASIQPSGVRDEWGHDFVQAQFVGQLINRRKVYPTALRTTLEQNYRLRVAADYTWDHVTEIRAARAIRRAEEFVQAIRGTGGQP